MIYGASLIRIDAENTYIACLDSLIDNFKSSTGMDPFDSGTDHIEEHFKIYSFAYFTFFDKHLGINELIDLRTIFLSFMNTSLHEIYGINYNRPGFIVLNDLKKPHGDVGEIDKIPSGYAKGLFVPLVRSGYTVIKFEE